MENNDSENNITPPNKDNPRYALEALMGASADFLGGKLRMTLASQVVISRLGLLFNGKDCDFADFIALAYAMYDDGDKERVYKVFREADKGKTEFYVSAIKWADSIGLSFSNANELALAFSKFFEKANNASTEYVSDNHIKGSSGNE